MIAQTRDMAVSVYAIAKVTRFVNEIKLAVY